MSKQTLQVGFKQNSFWFMGELVDRKHVQVSEEAYERIAHLLGNPASTPFCVE